MILNFKKEEEIENSVHKTAQRQIVISYKYKKNSQSFAYFWIAAYDSFLSLT